MKRGQSGLSCLFAIDKPVGATSHDIVNATRRIFGEKRVGHTGTLDPLASGVLPVLVGPATKLSSYLTSDIKEYVVDISFGRSTATDDAEGETLQTSDVTEELCSMPFAVSILDSMMGPSKQVPPVYSAIKVKGKKACDEARRGNVLELNFRDIEIYSAKLIALDCSNHPHEAVWRVDLKVSKGTYIRAIARDMGIALGCPAHVKALRRIQSGNILLDDCVSVETLEQVGLRAAIDPVRALGYRFAFADGSLAPNVENGMKIPEQRVELFAYDSRKSDVCACTSGVERCLDGAHEGELICMISNNLLKALYRYDATRAMYVPECVFQIGVGRGHDL